MLLGVAIVPVEPMCRIATRSAVERCPSSPSFSEALSSLSDGEIPAGEAKLDHLFVGCHIVVYGSSQVGKVIELMEKVGKVIELMEKVGSV